MNSNVTILKKFLLLHETSKNSNNSLKATHTSVSPNKSYYISEKDNDKFLNLYSKAIEEKSELHIIEQHTTIGPIVIDLDFRFCEEQSNRQFNSELIKDVVNLYQETIQECFKIKSTEQLEAFIFMRSKPYSEKKDTQVIIKDGIHIMFPYIISEPNIQELIRSKVLKNCSVIFEKLNTINPNSDIIDKSVIKTNGWFLFGSNKPNLEPYKLTHIYDDNIEELDIGSYDFGENIYKFLSIRVFDESKKTPFRESIIPELQKLDEMSIKRKNRQNKKKYNIYNIQSIKKILNILKKDRCEDYHQWLQIGMILHSINSGDDLLECWIEFSKKSTKFKDGVCEDNWDKFDKNGGLSIGTLYYFAKQDNPEKLMKIQSEDISKLVKDAESRTSHDIARILYEMFKYEFKFVSVKNNTWYQFINHRWKKVDKGITLKMHISNELAKLFLKESMLYNQLAASIVDEDCAEKKEYKRKATVYSNLVNDCKNTTPKENIMKESKEFFYDPTFINKLDTNPNLIGFENGIYDLSEKQFRDGRPDDYLTLSTKIDYIPYDELSEDTISEINDFMYKVFPNPSKKKYIFTLLSSFIVGMNNEQKFYIWTGIGGNGKSKLNELVVNCLGEYAIKLNITLLTGSRPSSTSANPELAGSPGTRFAYLEESNEGEKLNIGYMKELTGGDKLKTRALYSDPIEFIPQFKMLVLCNYLPEVGDDEATWRRMEVTEFESRFVDNPKKKNEFKKDKYLSKKMENWRETFISMLIKEYENYEKNGINVPECVKKFTNKYKENSDRIMEYINDNLIKSEDSKIDFKEIHENFKTWIFDNYGIPATKCISKRKLQNEFKKKLGEEAITPKHLKGYLLNEENF